MCFNPRPPIKAGESRYKAIEHGAWFEVSIRAHQLRRANQYYFKLLIIFRYIGCSLEPSCLVKVFNLIRMEKIKKFNNFNLLSCARNSSIFDLYLGFARSNFLSN